jgi:hypothetical protein
MQKPLAALLFGLMLLLAAGVVFIVGAITREGNLDAGEVPSESRERRARRAMAITAVLVVVLLYFGKAWWNVNATDFQRRVNFFKPPAAALQLVDGRLEIRVQRPEIAAERGSTRSAAYLHLSDVIPDHGHLMHLFLLRTPGLDAMWHLHPNPADDGAFVADLPDVPAGRYQVFADVVDPRGYPWTLIGSIDLAQIAGKSLTGDDSAWSGAPLSTQAADSTISPLPDGGRIVWQHPQGVLKAGAPFEFTFSVQDKDGRPVQDMEPYMGMAGHAEFVRSDLSVFAHVHPAGSVSMAALELAGGGEQNLAGPGTSAVSMATPMPMPESGPLPPEVRFPCGFPKPGDYRIYVQIKRAGKVETGVFDALVQ